MAPTAQKSFAPLPHTPSRWFPCGRGLLQHQSPTLHATADGLAAKSRPATSPPLTSTASLAGTNEKPARAGLTT